MELNDLRKTVKEKRLNLSIKEVQSLSKMIENNLFSLNFLCEKTNFFIYNSIKNEVNTTKIIARLKAQNKRVAYPIVEGENLIPAIPKTGEFERGDFGVLEPKKYTVMDDVEVVIVPLLLCDKNKNRVGYGKGFYDRYLAGKKVIKIGLAYDFQLVDALNPNPWDIKLDYVVTPTKII